MNIGGLGPPPYQTRFVNPDDLLSPIWSKWLNQLYTGLIPTFSSSQFSSGAQWSATSPTFIDPTHSGNDTLTLINSNVISLTPASSSKLGVAFTPSSVSSLFLINVQLQLQSAANWIAGRLWDGTTTIAYGSTLSMNLSGFYSPSTTSQVEVTVQLASDTGAVIASDPSGLASPAIFSVTQLK